jgi:hypothetical protein
LTKSLYRLSATIQPAALRTCDGIEISFRKRITVLARVLDEGYQIQVAGVKSIFRGDVNAGVGDGCMSASVFCTRAEFLSFENERSGSPRLPRAEVLKKSRRFSVRRLRLERFMGFPFPISRAMENKRNLSLADHG